MIREDIDRIVHAVLYEGYVLYPYRPSTVKNQQRWTFGGIYPRQFSEQHGESDPCIMQTECLCRATELTTLSVHVRFLQLVTRTVGALPEPLDHLPSAGEPEFRPVPSLRIGDTTYQSWEEATERDIAFEQLAVPDLASGERRRVLHIAPGRSVEPVEAPAGGITAVIVREHDLLQGDVVVQAHHLEDDLFRITVRVTNTTPMPVHEANRAMAQKQAFLSTHTVLAIEHGAFISQTDPPEDVRVHAATCRNIGTWPVMVGPTGATDAVLSSPIILEDYPQIAPESHGDLFDSAEIDEILSLRILAMTDDEKDEMRSADTRTRALLDRTESLTAEQFLQMHGGVRAPRGQEQDAPPLTHGLATSTSPLPQEREGIAGGMGADTDLVAPGFGAIGPGMNDMQPWWDDAPDSVGGSTKRQSARWGAHEVRPGDRVWLRPGGRADILDLALVGKIATIDSIEQDFEDKIYVAVTVDDDPGKEFGTMRMPGHRFFFSMTEIEPLELRDAPKRETL